MRHGLERIAVVQPPVDRSLEGSSAWLRVAREKARQRSASVGAADPGKQVIATAFKRARAYEPASAPLAREPARATATAAHGAHTSARREQPGIGAGDGQPT